MGAVAVPLTSEVMRAAGEDPAPVERHGIAPDHSGIWLSQMNSSGTAWYAGPGTTWYGNAVLGITLMAVLVNLLLLLLGLGRGGGRPSRMPCLALATLTAMIALIVLLYIPKVSGDAGCLESPVFDLWGKSSASFILWNSASCMLQSERRFILGTLLTFCSCCMDVFAQLSIGDNDPAPAHSSPRSRRHPEDHG